MAEAMKVIVVQGHRGYDDEIMFTWLGTIVDIPYKVHKLLGTLGPKLYFFNRSTRTTGNSRSTSSHQYSQSNHDRAYEERKAKWKTEHPSKEFHQRTEEDDRCYEDS